MPPFYKPPKETKLYPWMLMLDHNRIQHIPSRAFELLPIRWLIINDNDLVSAAEDAFVGVEHTLYGISFNSNNLTQLPIALESLRILGELKIQNNPLDYLDQSILSNISNSLQTLELGTRDQSRWPSEIRVLKKLSSLTIHSLPIKVYPDDIFQGLENSLTTLDFESTEINEIPRGLKTLKSLKYLMFNNNIYLTDKGFKNDSFEGMDALKELSITNSPLTYVPNLSSLNNLDHLGLMQNSIAKWDEHNLPDKPVLKSLELDQSSLSAVPSALSIIKTLESASFMYTNITNIKDGDLAGLQNLQYFYIGATPLNDISLHAFRDNVNLEVLTLGNTSVTEFPRALENLTNIHMLDFTDDKIPCTCASMGWTSHWRHTNMSWWIQGDCTNLNGTTINSFIHNNVSHCPHGYFY